MKETPTVQIAVVFPQALLKALDDLHHQLRKSSRAEVIREACEEYLKKRQVVIEPDPGALTKTEVKMIKSALDDIRQHRGKPWREAIEEI